MKKYTRYWVIALMLGTYICSLQAMASININNKRIYGKSDVCLDINYEFNNVNSVKNINEADFGNLLSNDFTVKINNRYRTFESASYAPILAVSPSSINFGAVEVGSTQSGVVRFYNNSGEAIEVSVSSNNAHVGINPTTFFVEGENYVDVSLTMEVVAEGNNSAQVTFSTSNETYPYIYATLSANGYLPAVIGTIPSEFNVTLKHGDVKSEDILISNSGTGVLNYNVSFDYDAVTPPKSLGLYAGLPSSKVVSKVKPLPKASSAFKADTKDGVLSSFSIPGVSLGTGLVWVNNLMYIVNYGSSNLYYYNPLDNTTNFVASIHSSPYGIAWDGTYLWIGNSAGYFYAYNLNGTFAGYSFSGPVSSYSSIYYHEGIFYLSPLWQTGIYKVDYTGSVLWSTTLPGGITGGQIIYIPSHTSGSIWVQSDVGGLIYQISNDFSSIVKSVSNGFSSSYCYAMTHNGTNFYSSSGSTVKIIDDGIDEQLNWLSTTSSFGEVQPGTEANLSFDISAENLSVGNYKGYVVISSNDINNSNVRIPINLTVTGQAEISVAQSSVDFGNVLINSISSQSVDILNSGGDQLTLSSFASTVPEFTYTIGSVSISPNENTNLAITFQPTVLQSYSGIISFSTNDPNNPTYSIAVQGAGKRANVNFVVKNAVTGDPINNAIVTFNGITQDEGAYTFSNIDGGSYSYSVSASGYSSSSGNVTVDQLEETVTVGLYESSSSIVMFNGDITSSCNNSFYDPGYTGNYSNNQDMILTIYPPSPNIMVKVDFLSFNLESGYDYLYVYDGINTGATALGTYTGTNLPPVFIATNVDGALTFSFHSDGSIVKSGWEANVTCVDHNAIEPLVFSIIDANSMLPVSGAYVSIDGLGSGYTDLSGNYSFGVVNGGTYTYSVLMNGYFEKTGSVYYPSQTSVDVELDRWPSVTFSVTSPDGDPVANALVNLGSYNATTDVAGNAVFYQVVPFTNYAWSISANGYQSISGEQFLAGEDIAVNAPFINALPSILFSVTDNLNNPVNNATVNLDGVIQNTDVSGQSLFQLSEPFQNHSWSVSAGGYKTVTGEQFAGNSPVNVDVQLQPDLVDLTLSVIDDLSGGTLPDAVVYFNGTRYITGNDGIIVLNGVTKGDYSVSAWRHTYYSYNGTLTVNLNAATIALTKIQSVSLPYSQSFNSSVPSNFSFYDVQLTNYETVWSFTGSSYAGGTVGEMNANWRNGVSTVRMILPPINTVGYSSVNLSFRHFFDDYASGMKVLVESSVDGNSWSPIGWEVVSGSGNSGPAQVSLTLSNNINSPNTYIAFTLTGDLYELDNWYVDDIQVTQPGGALYNASFTVYDDATSDVIEGAQVSIDGYGSMLSNSAGIVYFTGLANGDYVYTVTKDGYIEESGIVTVNNGNVAQFVGISMVSYYSINLTIYDQNTNTVIPGALVILEGSSASETNSGGNVSWDNVRAGSYNITISKEGYIDYVGTINVNGDVSSSIYLYQKYFSLFFTVLDNNSNSVSSALITVDGKSGIATNENGQAEISGLESGNYGYTVQKSGFDLYTSSASIVGADSYYNVVLSEQAPASYSILFRVTDLEGNPIGNANVALSGIGTVLTDGNGEVLYSGISSNESFTYDVSKADYLVSSGMIGPLTEDKEIVVVLKPVIVELYDVTFNVVDATGTALIGALVDIGTYGSATTNGAGNVTFTDIDFVDQLQYQVSLAGYQTANGSVAVHGDANVTVILPLIATTTYDVTFSITNSSGNSVDNAAVSLNGYGTIYTDNNGSAVFNQVNPQNGISYTVSKLPYANITGTLNVVDADVVQNLVLNTNIYRALFSAVDQFGKPYEGINISVLGNISTVTNSNGTAVVGGLSPGNYSYLASKPNETPVSGSFAISSADVPVNLTFAKPAYSVMLTVKDEFGNSVQDASVDLYGYEVKQTDSNGQVNYVSVTPANLPVAVSKTGYTTSSSVINIVDANVDQEITISLVRHSVQFSVVANNQPVNDAIVTFNGVTNSVGSYLFTDVLAGTGYAYTVKKTGYVDASGTVTVSDFTAVTVDMVNEKYPVTFNVSTPSSKGAKEFAAKLLIAGTTDTLDVGVSGQVVANFKSGYYSFKIWAQGFQDYYGSFEVKNSETSVNVTLSVSTNIDVNGISKVNAYPNPFSNQINLGNSSSVTRVAISNLIGQQVYQKNYLNTSKIIIETADLLSGIYFVKIDDEKGNTRVIKMIKE
ncbi:MAG: PEGA domain-containing protein [Bacteroidales bacterium]